MNVSSMVRAIVAGPDASVASMFTVKLVARYKNAPELSAKADNVTGVVFSVKLVACPTPVSVSVFASVVVAPSRTPLSNSAS